MNKNKAFTLLELMISLALFAIVTIMVMSLLDFATSSTTETERAAEAVTNSSITKEILVKTISPSTSIEILEPITTNDLSAYIAQQVANSVDDKEYIYLYSIDGVVYYRNPGTENKGKQIKTISTTDVDLEFGISSKSTRMLDINMTFSTKDVEPYILEENLSIRPLNFGKDEVVKDNRTDKSNPSNIIRYVSEEIVMEDIVEPVTDETPIIISATVYDVPISGSPNGKYNVPFYVSQKPRTIQLYNYSTLADKGNQITTDAIINNPGQVAVENKPDLYFKNTVIGQSTFLAKQPTTKKVKFVYKGHTFIDIYGNEYVGTDNGDGTKTIEYIIPTYQPTPGMQFAVKSEGGAYVAYDFKVLSGIPKPEIISFEFLPEDNNIPYRLKTYINENDVYYTAKAWGEQLPGTEGASKPMPFTDLWLGNQNIINNESFYSTIVMPTNRYKEAGDYYPTLGEFAHGTGNHFLNSRVATITFRGTSIIIDGNKVVVPEPERSKLNGVEEVTVKVTIDKNYPGDIYSLDGEKYADVYAGTDFEKYTFPAYSSANAKDEWFDPQYDVDSSEQKGRGYIFTVLNGNEAKRYTYQHEASTTKPDYHQGSTADSGLNRVWVDGYMEGAWVGGSMRSDVSGDIVVKVPHTDYDKIKDNVVLRASAYGKEIIQLPAYPYGTYSGANPTDTTDNYAYYGLDNAKKSNLTFTNYSSAPDAAIRYNAKYLKHFVLLQDTKEYGPLVRYQVKIEKSYPKGVLEPTVENIKIFEEVATNRDKTFIKNDGAFVPNSDMETYYRVGENIELNVAFAGSKVRIGESINPDLCTEFLNGISNTDIFYELKLQNVKYGKDYYIHVYDYEGVWKEAYRITTKAYKVRSTTVYDLDKEMSSSIADSGSKKQPFLPGKNKNQGSSYGYDDSAMWETAIYATSYQNVYHPVPYIGFWWFNVFSRAPKNLAQYTITGQGKTVSNDWRMFIRNTRTNDDYINGGNNINTPAQYNITNFMTPVQLNVSLGNTIGEDIRGDVVNTDEWVGDILVSERPAFKPSNVKLDTTGFSVKIFNDRVYSQKFKGGTLTQRSTGRPGTVVETNFDIALVDTTNKMFSIEKNNTTPGNPTAGLKYTIPHDNSAKPKEIQSNDVLGYGFSLIEQDTDRDPTQNYLGTGTVASTRGNREVALMFYVRHFVAGGGSTGIDLAKIPGSYVKIADLTGFDMTTTSSGGDTLNSQAVNFTVDVQTTYDGTTIISDMNTYKKVMENNYIGFTVTELDIQGKPTGVVHTKMYSFADVFGGIRIDDDFNELNLILNHRPRIIEGNNSNRKTRLSVGYGTNWGLVGISDFKIMR